MINSIFKIDSKFVIVELLGKNADDPRVQTEINLLSDKNFLEILIAMKIADFLKGRNEYYIVRGKQSNLYINYLLGITRINPYDKETILPFEFLLNKGNKDLIFDFNISTKIKEELLEYLSKITDGILEGQKSNGDGVLTNDEYKYLITLQDSNSFNSSNESNHSNFIEINLISTDSIDKISNYIHIFGYPDINLRKSPWLNEELFRKRKYFGLTGIDSDSFAKKLSSIESYLYGFDTFEYISGGLHGTGVFDKENEKIDLDTTHDYPTSVEKLYELCKEYGLSKEKAIEVCDFTKKGSSYRLKHFEEWNQAVKGLPESLIHYLNHIEYLFPRGHIIAYAEMNYLEVYYKCKLSYMTGRKQENNYYGKF